jgi:hypothetical protein
MPDQDPPRQLANGQVLTARQVQLGFQKPMRAALEIGYRANPLPRQRRIRVQLAGVDADAPRHLLQQAMFAMPRIELVKTCMGLGLGTADDRRQARHDLQVLRVTSPGLGAGFHLLIERLAVGQGGLGGEDRVGVT